MDFVPLCKYRLNNFIVSNEDAQPRPIKAKMQWLPKYRCLQYKAVRRWVSISVKIIRIQPCVHRCNDSTMPPYSQTPPCLQMVTTYYLRMREGNIFSLSTLAGRGEYLNPGLWVGGTPSQVWVGGCPISGLGGGHDILGLGGGYPISGLGGGYPISDLVGVPQPRSGWWGVPGVPLTRSGWWGYVGYPPTRSGWWGEGTWGTPPTIRQSSIASTCYSEGGVPLVFTQEDFLVYIDFQCKFTDDFGCNFYRL